MPYRVLLHRDVEKALTRLPEKIRTQLRDRIDALSETPRPSGSKELRGAHSGLRRVKSGEYRIIYQIKDVALLILILKVGPRKDIYR